MVYYELWISLVNGYKSQHWDLIIAHEILVYSPSNTGAELRNPVEIPIYSVELKTVYEIF